MDGSDIEGVLSRDRRISVFLKLSRTSADPCGVRLERSVGPSLPLPSDSDKHKDTPEEQLEEEEPVVLAEEAQACAAYLADLRKRRIGAAIQDDFYYWNKMHEADDAGKLFFIDSAEEMGLHLSTSGQIKKPSPTCPNHVSIFFDDNIERDRAHIVDVRRMPSFEPMTFPETQGKFLIKAEPWGFLNDEKWYISRVRRVLRERLALAGRDNAWLPTDED